MMWGFFDRKDKNGQGGAHVIILSSFSRLCYLYRYAKTSQNVGEGDAHVIMLYWCVGKVGAVLGLFHQPFC